MTINSLTNMQVAADSTVQLKAIEEGVFSIHISGTESNALSTALISKLLQALNKAKSEASLKVLIISGTEKAFLTGYTEAYNTAIDQKLYYELVSFPYPVIASVEGQAKGTGFLFAALCDFMVCSKSAMYGYTNSREQFYPSVAEYDLFKERFGEVQATDFLFQNIELNGEQLKEKGWEISVVASDEVSKQTQALATNLANKPQEALSLLKQHLSQKLISKVDMLSKVEQQKPDSAKGKKAEIKTKSEFIQIETLEQGVLHIDFSADKGQRGIKNLVKDLPEVFAQAQKSSQIKTVVLSSKHAEYVPNTAATKDVLSLQNLILESAIPVIAVLGSKANGKAWLISQFCDACIYSANGIYSINGLSKDKEFGRLASMIFPYNLGKYSGKEIVLTGKEYSSTELQEIVGTLQISDANKALVTAVELAKNWASLPKENVVSIKQAKSSAIKTKLQELPVWPDLIEEKAETVKGKIETITLKSKVVSAKVHPEGIVEIEMADKEAKNTFSEALSEGLNEVFAYINENKAYKVVILTGYDQYFSAGGTKDTLTAIQKGTAKFTDNKLCEITLKCNLPVIAAMQGHAVGGGWTLGMFADLTLFSSESKYFNPYMNYGFTPGAGATFIFPNKLGYDLSKETLLSANEFSGTELKIKGLKQPVIPRSKILQEALAIAKQIARNSRSALLAMKKQMSQLQAENLEKIYSQELEMHDKTFVGKADTIKQINENFNSNNMSDIEEKPASSSSNNTVDDVLKTLKKLLAHELHMQEIDIDNNTEFVDLGLDSITGVTWMRKINENYKTKIEATKVYSYPNLNKLSKFVHGIADFAKTEPIQISKVAEQTTAQTQAQQIITKVDTPKSNGSSTEVMSTIKKLLANELHMQEADIDENTQFIDLGLDSITSVTWMRKINEKYKVKIEATRVYTYSNLKKLAAYIHEQGVKVGSISQEVKTSNPIVTFETPSLPQNINIAKQKDKKLVSWRNKKSSRIATEATTKSNTDPIAVVGMAGQFPEANNLDQFWKNISEGKNCISEIPEKRWSIDKYYKEGNAVSGKTNCKWSGLMEEYDMFDPLFFNISPTEAESMDPQQRLFLKACWHAIEDSGYNADALSGSNCSVYVGCGQGDYRLQSKELQTSAQGFTGGDTAILAARISYFLNLKGTSLAIQTACSSSLVAIANACDSLNAGNTDMALAGGVYVMTGPEVHIKCAQTGMLSTDGRCFTFDQRANGFVPGEGVGVVMLKRLADAEKDGDIIHGVIRGWGINQDGKTNGITAPNPESQSELEQQVYNKFQINPEQIQLIEAHGTGTKLGDPIEVDALKETFLKYTNNKEYCALGSVKSNIGHCLTAAGVASFIKVLLSMKNRQLPPTINYENTNEHIEINDSPFYVNTELKSWDVENENLRQAAISGFGFSGTNAHIVLSDYTNELSEKPSATTLTQNGELMIPISARNEEQLKDKANDLLEFINKNDNINIVDLAYTLQFGRVEMEDRLGIMASTVEQLSSLLQAYINGETDSTNIQTGQVKRNKEGLSIISQDDDMKQAIIEKCISECKLSKLLGLWVKGMELDWNILYGEIKPNRITLPVYPFAKESYWYSENENNPSSEFTGVSGSQIHPLLHQNNSTLSQQSYTSIFTGDEFFLRDHKVNNQKFLPAVAYLEMVRAAIENATSDSNGVLEIHNSVWMHPVVVNKNKEVNIALLPSDDTEKESIDFDIYSTEENQELIHCQGQVSFIDGIKTNNLNIVQLKNEMQKGQLDASEIYANFSRMGLDYGEAHQGVKTIFRGEKQILAHLQLPNSVENDFNKYVLHPSLLDSALQSTIGLMADIKQEDNRPILPFAMDVLRVISQLDTEIYAWVRYTSANAINDKTIKVDIDLCDMNGKVCVQIKGFTSRYFEGEISANSATNKVADNSLDSVKTLSFDDEHYQKLLAAISNNEVSVDEAVELG